MLLYVFTLTYTKGEWKQQAGSEAFDGERWKQIIFPGDSSLIHQFKLIKPSQPSRLLQEQGEKLSGSFIFEE